MLAIFNAALIACLGYVFTRQDALLHTVFLSVIASIAGIIMSGLIVRDFRQETQKVSLRMNAVFLVLWMALIPVALLIDEHIIGAYQRSVGVVYLVWLCMVAIMPVKREHLTEADRKTQ